MGERRSIHSAEYFLRLDMFRSDVVVVILRIGVIARPRAERIGVQTKPRRDGGCDDTIAVTESARDDDVAHDSSRSELECAGDDDDTIVHDVCENMSHIVRSRVVS